MLASRPLGWAWTLGLAASVLGSCRCPSREIEELPPPTTEACLQRSSEGCLPFGELRRQLAEGEVKVEDARVTAQGTSKPQKIRLTIDGATYNAKWKPAPPSGDESNNSPRRELAAFALQRLILPEERQVVPPIALRCLPPQQAQKLSGKPLQGYGCVLGVLQYWVENTVELTDEHLESPSPELAPSLGDLNVLTYIAGHRDSAGLNFLLHEPTDRVFAVDNGMTFGAWELNPMRLFTSAWGEWRAPGLQSDTTQRLRALTREDFDQLAVVAELRRRGSDMVPAPASAPMDPTSGVRLGGDVIQLGLTTEEIDGVVERWEELLTKVDAGEVVLDQSRR